MDEAEDDIEFSFDETLDEQTTDQSWDLALSRGQQLHQALQSPSVYGRESKWQWHEYLETYGWSEVERQPPFGFHQHLYRMLRTPKAQGGLGISPDNGISVVWAHNRDSIVRHPDEGKAVRYMATRGFYTNEYYPHHGVIVAMDNTAPAAAVLGHPRTRREWKPPMVPLQHWSDVTFLEWQNVTSGKGMRKLRFVVEAFVTNDATKSVIHRGLANEGWTGEPPPFPGRRISIDSDAGKAVLGTENGQEIAGLILEHQRAFGTKGIDHIVVWRDPLRDDQHSEDRSEQYLNLLFVLRDIIDEEESAPSAREASESLQS